MGNWNFKHIGQGSLHREYLTKGWKEIKKGSSPVGHWRVLFPGRETNEHNNLEAGAVWHFGETVGKPLGVRRNEPGEEEKDNICRIFDTSLVFLILCVELPGL